MKGVTGSQEIWCGLADSLLLQREDLRLIARLSRRLATLLQASGVKTLREGLKDCDRA